MDVKLQHILFKKHAHKVIKTHDIHIYQAFVTLTHRNQGNKHYTE